MVSRISSLWNSEWNEFDKLIANIDTTLQYAIIILKKSIRIIKMIITAKDCTTRFITRRYGCYTIISLYVGPSSNYQYVRWTHAFFKLIKISSPKKRQSHRYALVASVVDYMYNGPKLLLYLITYLATPVVGPSIKT